MKLNLHTKLIMFFISLLLVFGAVLFFTVHSQVTNLATQNILNQLNYNSNMGLSLINQTYAGDWSVKDGKLYKGDKVINDDIFVVDELKKQADSVSSIFVGDVRISTNVLNEDGSRSIGTKVSSQVAQIVLTDGKGYTGEAYVNDVLHESKYVPIKDSNGKVIGIWSVAVQKENINNEIKKLDLTIGFAILIAIIVGVIILIVFTNIIVKNVNKILAVLKEISKGNFKVKTDIKSRDEIGMIGDNVNLMVDNVSGLINEIKEMSVTVASSSEEMMASSEEVCKVSEQVAIAITEIAKGASEQAVSIEKGNAGIQEIVQGLDKIVMDMGTTKGLTEKAKHAVEIGEKSVQFQEGKMNENTQVSANVASAITQLSQKSQEIGQILEVIKSIAEQTNLLALNAAIEAARAGEAGKGFAVVADEIRKLAEQSGTSVKEIGEIIKEVQSGVLQAVSEMGKAEIMAGEQSKALEDTVKAFYDISTAVKFITENVKLVTDASKNLSDNAKQAGDNITDIAGISQETAAGTEEVAASTEEQTSIIHQIAGSAEDLAKLASNLQQKVVKFNV